MEGALGWNSSHPSSIARVPAEGASRRPPFGKSAICNDVSDCCTNFPAHAKCYVSRCVLTRRLTSESEARKKRDAMITAIRKQLDTCTASGCLSPSWSHSLLGEFMPRVNTIEL
jgi:hypothetical protein